MDTTYATATTEAAAAARRNTIVEVQRAAVNVVEAAERLAAWVGCYGDPDLTATIEAFRNSCEALRETIRGEVTG